MKAMQMKKSSISGSALMLVLMLLLTLVGCGGEEASSQPAESAASSSTVSEASSAVSEASSEASEAAASSEAELEGPSPAEITGKIMDTLTFEDEMMEISSDIIERQYDVDMSTVASASVYVVSSGALADEVAVFRANSEADVAAIQAALEARVQTVMDRFVDYLPDEVPKIEGAIVKTDGLYALMVIHDDAAEAETIFDESL